MGALSYDAIRHAPTSKSLGYLDNSRVLGSHRWTYYLEVDMGKYVFAWLLGVPAFVLVIIYFFAH